MATCSHTTFPLCCALLFDPCSPLPAILLLLMHTSCVVVFPYHRLCPPPPTCPPSSAWTSPPAGTWSGCVLLPLLLPQLLLLPPLLSLLLPLLMLLPLLLPPHLLLPPPLLLPHHSVKNSNVRSPCRREGYAGSGALQLSPALRWHRLRGKGSGGALRCCLCTGAASCPLRLKGEQGMGWLSVTSYSLASFKSHIHVWPSVYGLETGHT